MGWLTLLFALINDADRPPNVNHYHTDGIFRRRAWFDNAGSWIAYVVALA